jgi:hypothetical protein
MLDDKLITWKGMDIPLIQESWNKTIELMSFELANARSTRDKIKKYMEDFLPQYEIKCNEENNPSDIMESGRIMVRIQTRPRPDHSYSYIDAIY